MQQPRIDLRCLCSGEMVGVVSPASKIAPLREIFMSAHNGPGCAVADCSSDNTPGPAPLLRGDAVELPGFGEVPESDTGKVRPWSA